MNQKNYTITKDMIVNDVVNKYPQTNEIFTRYGVDTCCGGIQSIEKTAAACNVNLDEVLKTLNEAIPEQTKADEKTKDETVVTESPPVADTAGPETGGEITGNTTVKEIIKHNPETKGVFSKYGLLECGGEYGPEEAIYFFARVHNVDPDCLLKELNDVISGKVAAPEVAAEDAESAYENIYEKFIKTAIIIALSTGCVYGALILFYMGIQHSLYAVPKVLIEMGVSYFILPRFYAVRIYSGKLANLSFYFMVAGIILVFTYRTLLPINNHYFFKILIMSGCLLEVAAVLMFLIVAIKTVLSAEKQELETYETFLFSGYLWFLIVTVAHAGIIYYMLNAGETLIPHAAIYPLRHIQVMGFITLVIFGVVSRTLPAFLGLKTPNAKINLIIMFMLNASVFVRAVSQPLMKYYADVYLPFYYVFNTLYFTSGCVELLSILLFLYNLNILSKPEVDFSGMEIEKSYEKFIWAGIFWLLFAEIGMMVFGFASRIIPISQGIKLHSYSLLTMTFILIIVGCVLRVIFQPLAVHTGSVPAYLVMGISGLIESVAIVLFGINIWKTMSDGKRQGTEEEDVHDKITSVTALTNVHQLMKQHPQTIDILVSKGFTQLKNPVLRNTLARAVNIGQAIKIHHTDLDQLLKELNESLKS